MDITSLKYKEIKDLVDKIDFSKEIHNEKVINLAEELLKDSRKNVNSLGNKIINSREKILKEIKRVKKMYEFDKAFKGYNLVAGVDEVGRGPLAGPIVACAVILDENVLEDEMILGLNDSKKVPAKKREELAKIIKEKAIAYYIAVSSNEEIDEKGIAYANNKVFLEACTSLKCKPDLVLSDGYLVKNLNIDNKYVIKGDTKSADRKSVV